MSLVRSNIIANYVGQAWVALAGLIFLPVYLHFVGPEGFGLIGFYTMLVSSMVVLDMGFGTTAKRELARFSIKGGDDGAEIRDLVRSLEILFFGIAVVFAIFIFLFAPLLVTKWLNLESIETKVAVDAVRLMSFALVFQFLVIFYNECLIGLQKQVALNIVNIVVATVKYGGAALILAFLSPKLSAFFLWQILTTGLNCVVVSVLLWRAMPKGPRPRFVAKKVRDTGRFSLSVGAINTLGLLLTNIDKIILSGLLSLKHFGYYTLAWTLSTVVFRLVIPISQAYFPKLVQLVKQNEVEGLFATYQRSSQLSALAVVPVALLLAFFSFEIVSVWTQDSELAREVRWAVALLSAGSMLNGMMRQPYNLQLAFGWTSLALWTNVVAIIIIVPLTIFLASNYGIEGAATAWLLLNLGYVLVTPNLMHRRILRFAKFNWYLEAVASPVFVSTVIYFIAYLLLVFDTPVSILDISHLAMIWLLAALAGATVMSQTRLLLKSSIRQLLGHKKHP